MAGYDWARGKSNNAVEAEFSGLVTVSQVTRHMLDIHDIDCSVKVAKKILNERVAPREWHHTSKAFNRTYYYSLHDLRTCISELKEAGRYSQFTDDAKEERTFTRRKAYWSEWECSGPYGKRILVEKPTRDGVSDGKYFYYSEDDAVKVNLRTIRKLIREKKTRKKLITGSHFKFVK